MINIDTTNIMNCKFNHCNINTYASVNVNVNANSSASVNWIYNITD